MYRIARAINGISINGNEYVLDDDGEIRKFETKEEALELLGTTEEEAEEAFIFIEEIEEYPYCTAVQEVLKEYRNHDLEDYDHPLGMVEQAYDCNQGCIHDGFWDLACLDVEIIRKFRYAIAGVLYKLGIGKFDVDFDIVVEPNVDDCTTYIVRKVNTDDILLHGHCKAWHFGHHGGLDELEGFFESLAEEVEEEQQKKVIGVDHWLRDGKDKLSDLCDSTYGILNAAHRLMEKRGAEDIVGEILFRGDDGKMYTGSMEYHIVEADPDYVADVLDQLADEDAMEQERKDNEV